MPEVIQVACVTSDGKDFNHLLCPSIPIEPGATETHHITMDMVAGEHVINDLWPQLSRFVKAYPIVGYNVTYDILAINNSLHNHDIASPVSTKDVFDVMLCYADFYGELNPSTGSFKWQKLDEALEQTNIGVPVGHHDAMVDVRSTIALLRYISNQRTTWEWAIHLVYELPEFTPELIAAIERITYGRFV